MEFLNCSELLGNVVKGTQRLSLSVQYQEEPYRLLKGCACVWWPYWPGEVNLQNIQVLLILLVCFLNQRDINIGKHCLINCRIV